MINTYSNTYSEKVMLHIFKITNAKEKAINLLLVKVCTLNLCAILWRVAAETAPPAINITGSCAIRLLFSLPTPRESTRKWDRRDGLGLSYVKFYN